MLTASVQRCGLGILHATFAFLLIMAAGAHAGEEIEDLYTTALIITGTLERERQRGFAEGLEQVLVKVSGDPTLAGSPAMVRFATRADQFVESYELRERMEGMPVNDEQGTRERPHILTIRFSRSGIDRLLRNLGRQPWLERPPITVLLIVDNGTQRFVVARDSLLGAGQRGALQDRSKALGLEVEFPDEAMLADVHPERNLPGPPDGRRVETIRRELGSEVLLAGLLVWDAPTYRWHSQWQLATETRTDLWDATGISFDVVFRETLESAMRVLSSEARS
jgi:hypothetical protein